MAKKASKDAPAEAVPVVREEEAGTVAVPETGGGGVPAHLAVIHESLRHLAVPIDQLVPDPANTRSHGERNLAVIAASLAEFGQDQPVVVRKATGVIVKGNGRRAAALMLGWTHLAALYVDDDTLAAMRRSIVDNRSAELAGWEHQLLAQHLSAAKEAPGGCIETLGFTDADLASLVVEWPSSPSGEHGQEPQGGEPQALFVIKVDGIRIDDKQAALDAVQRGLDDAKLAYKAKLL